MWYKTLDVQTISDIYRISAGSTNLLTACTSQNHWGMSSKLRKKKWWLPDVKGSDVKSLEQLLMINKS